MNHCLTLRKPYVALVVLLLAAVFLAAPAGSQPEKLSNAQPDWDTGLRSFVIEFRATADLAKRAVEGHYVLVTLVTVTDRSGKLPTVSLTPDPFLAEELGEDTRGSGLVRLRPQIIAWDQEDNSYVGRFNVEVSTELQALSGETVARTEPKSRLLCLPIGGTDVAKTC